MEMNKEKGAYSSNATWILPKDSRAFIDQFILENTDGVYRINPSLSHNRFLKVGYDKKNRRFETSGLDPELKRQPVKDKSFCGSELVRIMNLANERNTMLAHTFPDVLWDLYQPDKLIIGTGGSTPYGNVQMIRLHSIYGIPYIPASAIKGSMRNCWILEEFDGNETLAQKDESFRSLFGSAEEEKNGGRRGALVFFDLFPSTFSIGFDVQTPHFSNGYTDDQNPIPVYFTCLLQSEFKVILSCRDQKVWIENCKKIKYLLHLTLTQYGIGAKTALGYGIG